MISKITNFLLHFWHNTHSLFLNWHSKDYVQLFNASLISPFIVWNASTSVSSWKRIRNSENEISVKLSRELEMCKLSQTYFTLKIIFPNNVLYYQTMMLEEYRLRRCALIFSIQQITIILLLFPEHHKGLSSKTVVKIITNSNKLEKNISTALKYVRNGYPVYNKLNKLCSIFLNKFIP